MVKGFDGLVAAVTTPFGDDGLVDEGMFVRHVEFLAGHGVTKLLVGGTTGEFFSLLGEERLRLLEVARGCFEGTIFYHAGCDCLLETKRQAVAQNKIPRSNNVESRRIQ